MSQSGWLKETWVDVPHNVPKLLQLLVQRGFLYDETKVTFGALRVKSKIIWIPSKFQSTSDKPHRSFTLTSYFQCTFNEFQSNSNEVYLHTQYEFFGVYLQLTILLQQERYCSSSKRIPETIMPIGSIFSFFSFLCST